MARNLLQGLDSWRFQRMARPPGEKFRMLNYRNLGKGAAWDVLSGVDLLVISGQADPAR
jgi:hypothetical protein